MHATVQSGGHPPKRPNVPSTSQQLKAGSDGAQNCGPSKGKKRDRGEQGYEYDPAKRDRDFPLKLHGSEPGNVKWDSAKSEIAEMTEKDGLPHAEAVEKLVMFMQLDQIERKLDFAGRVRIADIIAATESPDCLRRFMQLRGLPVLNDWLQETQKGRSGEGTSPKETDKPIEELILAVLRALAKLPISLNALQSCSIGKSVNHLRSYKNPEIQRNAKCIVDTWKKRIDAEMKSTDARPVLSSQAVSWSGKVGFPKSSSAGNRRIDSSETISRSGKVSFPEISSAGNGRSDSSEPSLKNKVYFPSWPKAVSATPGAADAVAGDSLAFKEQSPTTPVPQRSFSSKWMDIRSSSNVLEHIMLDESAEPTNLPLALLQYITDDFADKRQVGRGGFGVVYKGDLQNGSVAVKRLLNSHTIEEEPFYREATSLISVKHKNIVRFLGYCANTESKAMIHPESGGTLKYVFAEIRERLLCFEYINNGSLDRYLTDELRGLEWHTRYQIIRGICDGLVYLHKEKGIVHRDMKPANILLDDLMIPKITDFGISKFLEGATHAVTCNPTWSFGYCAPEFINHGVVSIKSDIYCLGVIIKEVMTGCKDDPDNKHVLRRWRYRWNKSGKYSPLGYEQVTKCIEIALRCLSECPKRRPYVWDIISMFNELESANQHVDGADESPVFPIRPYPWELLEFDKLELNFPFEINKPIPCSLELTNITDGYVAFDVEISGVLQYCVEPNKGVVPPRSRCNVMVTLQPREKAPHAIMCKDEFVVRCATVEEGLAAQDITEDMFDGVSGKVVDEVTLKVVI